MARKEPQVDHAERSSPDDSGKVCGVRLLLVGLRSPINVGMILRVAETYRAPVATLDCDAVLGNATNIATVSDFACGALQRFGFTRLGAFEDLRQWLKGSRLIATTIAKAAVRLPDFTFTSGDVIAFGSEYDGLDERVLSRADSLVTIPMADVWTPKPKSSRPIDPARASPPSNDGRPNLNVAISVGIVCYTAFIGGVRATQGC